MDSSDSLPDSSNFSDSSDSSRSLGYNKPDYTLYLIIGGIILFTIIMIVGCISIMSSKTSNPPSNPSSSNPPSTKSSFTNIMSFFTSSVPEEAQKEKVKKFKRYNIGPFSVGYTTEE